jgi:transposase
MKPCLRESGTILPERGRIVQDSQGGFMDRTHYIGLDGHARSCDLAVVSAGGRSVRRWHLPTSIPELVEAIESVAKPRKLTLEEGPMADWFMRRLAPYVDELVVCDPRRNALIGKDQDKTDAIDARTLAELYRGGYLRAVHHPASEDRELFKRHVALYHDRVVQRVREGNKVLGFFRRFGIVETGSALEDADQRNDMLRRLAEGGKHALACEDAGILLESYDLAKKHERKVRRSLEQRAKGVDIIGRWVAVPGVKWIRASTLYVYLDTPDRFRSKSALWKYLGIGLMKKTSGQGPVVLRPTNRCNRALKATILGAAKSAAREEGSPFRRQYQRLIKEGHDTRIALRVVARTLATVLWGMWKHGGEYDPGKVGPPGGKGR